MKKAIIGAGGFGREVYQSLPIGEQNKTSFFVHDEFYKQNDESIFPLSKLDINEYEVIVAVGDPSDRKKIIESLPENTKFFTHVHESVIIMDKNVEIGEGSIICAGSIITTNVKIGKHAHLNLQTTVGHDTAIGNFFTTAPGVKISGNCTIGNCVYFGTNSSVREKIKICDKVTIGLNGGVVKDVTEEGVYVGVPVKKIR
jgi:sugar O-acyltransferase (sialic acid O-acetyltransferase NeuD family)